MNTGDRRLPRDAPSTPEEWRLEWLVLVERMRAEPATWQAQRWPLHELDYVPPVEFIRDLLAGWYRASALYDGLDTRARAIENEGGPAFRPEAHPEYDRAVRAIDACVSGEKSRRLRERLTIGAGELTLAPVPPRSADRVRLCREAATRLRRDTGQVTVSAISTATGFTRETVAGYVTQGWLKLTED